MAKKKKASKKRRARRFSEMSKNQLITELRIARIGHTTDMVTSLGRTALNVFGACFLAWQAQLAIGNLAGETTIADFTVSFLKNVGASNTAAWSTTTFAVIYARAQYIMKRRTIERLQGRIRTFEAEVDPDRSSSDLTSGGETRREDI